MIASAWHLQAPDSLSPKDILKNTELLTRVSSDCLEKDAAQNYSNIGFSYFFNAIIEQISECKIAPGIGKWN